MLTIDKTSGEPAYLQLIRQIKRDVVLGIRRAGDRLPTIVELAEALNLAKPTVGQAIMELQKQGVIETRKSQGSFVLPPSTELLDEFARAQLAPAILECKRIGLAGGKIEALFAEILAAQFVERNKERDRRVGDRDDAGERRGTKRKR